MLLGTLAIAGALAVQMFPLGSAPLEKGSSPEVRSIMLAAARGIDSPDLRSAVDRALSSSDREIFQETLRMMEGTRRSVDWRRFAGVLLEAGERMRRRDAVAALMDQIEFERMPREGQVGVLLDSLKGVGRALPYGTTWTRDKAVLEAAYDGFPETWPAVRDAVGSAERVQGIPMARLEALAGLTREMYLSPGKRSDLAPGGVLSVSGLEVARRVSAEPEYGEALVEAATIACRVDPVTTKALSLCGSYARISAELGRTEAQGREAATGSPNWRSRLSSVTRSEVTN